jgi:hypothetical protein
MGSHHFLTPNKGYPGGPLKSKNFPFGPEHQIIKSSTFDVQLNSGHLKSKMWRTHGNINDLMTSKF